MRSICMLAVTLSLTSTLGAGSVAQEGGLTVGQSQMLPRLASVEQQNAQCNDVASALLGPLVSGLTGIGAWENRHPMKERNCVTLFDVPPLDIEKELRDMAQKADSLFSIVRRYELPASSFGGRIAMAFAWCADRICLDNRLIVFDQNRMIGYCKAETSPKMRTLYVVDDPGRDAIVAGDVPYTTCISSPTKTLGIMLNVEQLQTARRIANEPSYATGHDGGVNSRRDYRYVEDPTPPRTGFCGKTSDGTNTYGSGC